MIKGHVGKLSWGIGPSQVLRFGATIVWSHGHRMTDPLIRHRRRTRRVGRDVILGLTTWPKSGGWIADALWYRPRTTLAYRHSWRKKLRG